MTRPFTHRRIDLNSGSDASDDVCETLQPLVRTPERCLGLGEYPWENDEHEHEGKTLHVLPGEWVERIPVL